MVEHRPTDPVCRTSRRDGLRRVVRVWLARWVEEDEFWGLINGARSVSADPAAQAVWLEARLEESAVATEGEKIRDFDHHFWHQMQRAFRWDLWGVATLVHGAGGQEPFLAFRAWLISRGEVVFRGALADPDSLADVVVPRASGLPLCHVGRRAWAATLATELPTPTMDLFVEPRGTPIKESDLPVCFPRVAAALRD